MDHSTMRPLASALTFVALAAPVASLEACDHLASLGQNCTACAAPASAIQSGNYGYGTAASSITTTTTTTSVGPAVNYVQPSSDIVIPDPLPLPPDPTPVAPPAPPVVVPPVAPSCNSGGAASAARYSSYSYSTLSQGALQGLNAHGYTDYHANAAAQARNLTHASNAELARAIRRQNAANAAVLRGYAQSQAQRAVRQDAYHANGQAQDVQPHAPSGKVKSLPRLRNALGSLFGKP